MSSQPPEPAAFFNTRTHTPENNKNIPATNAKKQAIGWIGATSRTKNKLSDTIFNKFKKTRYWTLRKFRPLKCVHLLFSSHILQKEAIATKINKDKKKNNERSHPNPATISVILEYGSKQQLTSAHSTDCCANGAFFLHRTTNDAFFSTP